MNRNEFVSLARLVLPPRLRRWSEQIGAAAELSTVCPWLIAAVMERETQGGEAPGFFPNGDPAGTGDFGEEGTPSFRDRSKGELGHGRGLMQIDDRSHRLFIARKLGDGRFAWQDPLENIGYSAIYLGRLIAHFAQPQLRLDLKLALAAAVASYNCGEGNVSKLLATRKGSLEEQLVYVDRLTAKPRRDYSQWVLRLHTQFLLHAAAVTVHKPPRSTP